MKNALITITLFLCLAFVGCTVEQQDTVDAVAEGVQTAIESNPQIISTAVTLFPKATYYIATVLALCTGWQKYRRTTETGELKTALIDSNTPGAIAEPTRELLKKNGVVDPIVSNPPAGVPTC